MFVVAYQSEYGCNKATSTVVEVNNHRFILTHTQLAFIILLTVYKHLPVQRNKGIVGLTPNWYK